MANKKEKGSPARKRGGRKSGTRSRTVRRTTSRRRPSPPIPPPAPVFDPFTAFPSAPPAPGIVPIPEARTLPFGARDCVLRPLTPADEPLLISFFKSHSEETIRQRYGYRIAEMTHERALRLLAVDQAKDLALGVLVHADDGTEELDAVGRYLLDADGRSAEMAFVVRENRRRLGMCTALLRALLANGWLRGMNHLHAQVQSDNSAMLSIFRNHGARIQPIPGADTMDVFVPTAQDAGASAAPATF